eukprot:g4215.t1
MGNSIKRGLQSVGGRNVREEALKAVRPGPPPSAAPPLPSQMLNRSMENKEEKETANTSGQPTIRRAEIDPEGPPAPSTQARSLSSPNAGRYERGPFAIFSDAKEELSQIDADIERARELEKMMRLVEKEGYTITDRQSQLGSTTEDGGLVQPAKSLTSSLEHAPPELTVPTDANDANPTASFNLEVEGGGIINSKDVASIVNTNLLVPGSPEALEIQQRKGHNPSNKRLSLEKLRQLFRTHRKDPEKWNPKELAYTFDLDEILVENILKYNQYPRIVKDKLAHPDDTDAIVGIWDDTESCQRWT